MRSASRGRTRSARIGLCGFTLAMEDYARHFPVVEVQNTFYEPPRDEVMRRWRAVTAPALEYTMNSLPGASNPRSS
jgi:uncharacterized protein YecE (DUF72 family)